jgi:non-heme chloroperoxidase
LKSSHTTTRFFAFCLCISAFLQAQPIQSIRVQLDNKIELHYVELGKGEPVVFVHGGLEDYRIWQGQMDSFARRFRVIAYSRRYNFPNRNRMTANDHSALVEAADLALLLRKLNLGPVHLIGSSYGAFTALVLAIQHPELVKTLTLAEPPVHRWAGDLPEGKKTFEKFMSFWNSVGDAFRRGDSNKALRVSVNFFSEGHDTFDTLPSEARQGMLENIAEWKALTTSKEAFPPIKPAEIQQIKIPVLLMCGEKTLPIHQLVNGQLERFFRGNSRAKRITISGATHDMWSEQPEVCRKAVFDFLGAR